MSLKNYLSRSNTVLFSNRRKGEHINFYNLYLLYFDKVPNAISEERIDCKKADIYFKEKYKNKIKEHFSSKSFYEKSKQININESYYVLDNIIVTFRIDDNEIHFLFDENQTDKIDAIIADFLQFKKRNKRELPEISLLINTSSGIDTTSLKITKPKLKIEDNYNDDFIEIHQNILKRLSKKNDKGIVLLHGKSGTGKTSYIRYLITSLKKEVIFLPPNMAVAITNPDFLSVLVENPNSIFVIEDAENIVLDREQGGSSAVSTLLNLSDGLLADCLNIQIICSFNTDISKIDAALMRKGRLIAKYEFKALEINKAQHLSDKLGFENKILKPTILTDIYNQNENEFKEEKTKIGF